MKKLLKTLAGFAAGIAIGIAAGAFMVWTVIQFCGNIFKDIGISGFIIAWGIFIVYLFVSIFLQTIIHEAGHLIFGLLTGYRFSSFRIGSYTLVRVKGRLKIKKYAIAGTAGQCLMLPPEKAPEQMPYFWYNAGGAAMNLITSAVSLAIAAFTGMTAVATSFFVVLGMAGIYMAIANGLPMRMGGMNNDGYNIRCIMRDRTMLHILYRQLSMAGALSEGIRYKDMPEDLFTKERSGKWNNILNINDELMYANRLMDLMQFDEARAMIEEYYTHRDEMPDLLKKELACETVFLRLVCHEDAEKVTLLLTKEIRSYINIYGKISSSKLRTQFAIALLLDKDRKEAEKILGQLKNRRDRYLMRGEAESDIAIMDEVMKVATHSRSV